MSAKQSLQARKHIYVVFGPEKLVYIIVHNMSVEIILPAACKNGVVVVVSIFLRPFFLVTWQQKEIQCRLIKRIFVKNNVPKALDFFKIFFFPPEIAIFRH
jgi:hypothetical protein